MYNRPSLPLALLALAFAGACASASKAPGAVEESTSVQQSSSTRNRDIITQAEISAPGLGAQNVFEAVRQLRPQFLVDRGTQQSTSNPETGRVHVSIDGQRILPVDELKSIMVRSVVEVRYLNAAAAMQKFGVAALQGPVILVRTQM